MWTCLARRTLSCRRLASDPALENQDCPSLGSDCQTSLRRMTARCQLNWPNCEAPVASALTPRNLCLDAGPRQRPRLGDYVRRTACPRYSGRNRMQALIGAECPQVPVGGWAAACEIRVLPVLWPRFPPSPACYQFALPRPAASPPTHQITGRFASEACVLSHCDQPALFRCCMARWMHSESLTDAC